MFKKELYQICQFKKAFSQTFVRQKIKEIYKANLKSKENLIFNGNLDQRNTD